MLRHTIIYTDGSCLRNGSHNPRAGIGFFWPDHEDHNISQPLHGRQTNQRAEIVAATMGIEHAVKFGYQSITVRLDSRYVQKAIAEHMHDWLRSNWSRRIKNKDDFLQLWRAIYQAEQVKFEHIDREYNRRAGSLAKYGANM